MKKVVNDIETMRLKFKEFVLSVPQGIVLKNVTKEDAKRNVEQKDKSADESYKVIAVNVTDDYVFTKFKDLNDGKQVRDTIIYIGNFAKAYETPNSKYYQSTEIKDYIIKGLEIFSNKAYYINGRENGNWWFWEIGISKTLNETLVIAYDIVPEKLRVKLLEASRYFQPDPRYSGASPGAIYSTAKVKRLSEGGNRLDTAFVSFIRGILVEDENEIRDGINAVDIVAKSVDKGDGLYDDGSFVQHTNVSSNGSYGAVLLDGFSLFTYITENTIFKMNNPYIDNLYNNILEGNSYLLINGGINDSVRGRGISRDKETDLDRARIIIESIASISEGASPIYKDKLKSLVKKVILENNLYETLESIKNLSLKSIVKDIIADTSVGPLNLNKIKIFSAMDRVVQLGDNGGGFAISMHSKRVANYETINKENLKGWHTGDGMTYIYANDSSGYIDFWPTVNHLLLAGTTESGNARINSSGERRVGSSVSPKTWVGGSTNGQVGFIGMDFISWNDKTEAKKSWLLLGNEIVAMGSNIKSTDDTIFTVIDNKIINTKDNSEVYVNSVKLIDLININKKGDYIEYENTIKKENIGYILLQDQNVEVKIEDRSGKWEDIGGKSQNIITKKYLQIVINQGQNPIDSTYSYLILPNFTKTQITNYNINDIEILKQDDMAHVIKIPSKNLIAINSWANNDLEIENIKLNGTISLIAIENNDKLELTISDPTHEINGITKIEIKGEYELDKLIKEVKLTIINNNTNLEIDLPKLGQSITVGLTKK
ncbi:polysaccharide lyase 8 family protein [Oceanivirga salmonicida]|uniref:polysaccharide lyase 8 family protein n=1 Tax=Oceanivirga salmonicida TaxID=1769291 RepID=UPI00083234CF|nr:polysaccharide lyase 8 family protein [Oceanivirga salmonicida]